MSLTYNGHGCPRKSLKIMKRREASLSVSVLQSVVMPLLPMPLLQDTGKCHQSTADSMQNDSLCWWLAVHSNDADTCRVNKPVTANCLAPHATQLHRDAHTNSRRWRKLAEPQVVCASAGL